MVSGGPPKKDWNYCHSKEEPFRFHVILGKLLARFWGFRVQGLGLGGLPVSSSQVHFAKLVGSPSRNF